MRVSNKMIYGHFAYAYGERESAIHKLDKQISSGKRIEKPSDDPFGTARAMSFRTNITEVEQYTKNSHQAISWLNITDNALLDVDTYLHRVRELTIQGANDSLTNEARKALAAEVDQINASLMQIANTTIDNRFVFGGEKYLEKAYESRNPVASRNHNLGVDPIVIGPGNNQLNLAIDGVISPLMPITLTNRTYDGTPGNTLDDLVTDIQTQLRAIGFTAPNLPVNVKATPDGRLEFYAGTQPPDGITHTVVLLQEPGFDALPELGFLNEATTKELVSEKVDFPVMVMGKNAVCGKAAAAPGGGTTVDLDPIDAKGANYYNNWTLIVDDNGNVQSQRVTAYAANTVTVGAGWNPPLGPNTKYYLSPPMTGTITNVFSPTEIDVANLSTVADFYVGMPITISDGTGQGQTQTITDYDQATGRITVGQAWSPPLAVGSRIAIDPHSFTNANNKFKITVGTNLTQEISLDTGDYSPAAFAQMIENKIRERGIAGSDYDNIRVYMTPNNELRIVPRDPLTNNPPSIKLESGSTADALWLMGFKDGAVSNELLPNFEGNRSGLEYEINVGVRMKVNINGDKLFDPLFKHLAKISMDLRAGNVKALSNDDLRFLKEDLDNVLIAQGELGAKVNRMEKALDRFGVINETINKLLSNVEDTDLTKAVMDLKMHETAYQAALQSGARIMPMSLLQFLQ